MKAAVSLIYRACQSRENKKMQNKKNPQTNKKPLTLY